MAMQKSSVSLIAAANLYDAVVQRREEIAGLHPGCCKMEIDRVQNAFANLIREIDRK